MINVVTESLHPHKIGHVPLMEGMRGRTLASGKEALWGKELYGIYTASNEQLLTPDDAGSILAEGNLEDEKGNKPTITEFETFWKPQIARASEIFGSERVINSIVLASRADVLPAGSYQVDANWHIDADIGFKFFDPTAKPSEVLDKNIVLQGLMVDCCPGEFMILPPGTSVLDIIDRYGRIIASVSDPTEFKFEFNQEALVAAAAIGGWRQTFTPGDIVSFTASYGIHCGGSAPFDRSQPRLLNKLMLSTVVPHIPG